MRLVRDQEVAGSNPVIPTILCEVPQSDIPFNEQVDERRIVMAIMTIEQIKAIYERERHITLELKAANIIYHIDPIFTMALDENNSHIIDRTVSFEIYIDEPEYELIRKCRTFDTLVKFLVKNKVIIDSKCDVVSINGFSSIVDMEEHRAFLDISMSKILTTFSSANRFCLCENYGDYRVSETLADDIFNFLLRNTFQFAGKEFDALPQSEKLLLPSFEDLFTDIKSECDAFDKMVLNGGLKEEESPFIVDRYYQGLTKYTNDGLYHLYSSIHLLSKEYSMILNDASTKPHERDIKSLFLYHNFIALERHLLKSEVTFVTHCTTGTRLMIVHYFSLNEETKEWLLQFKDDYSLPEEVEDLALYEDEKCIFSSCTHEHLHADLREKK